MTSGVRRLAFAALLLVATANTALAQPAARHVKLANEAYAAEDFEGALDHYQSAYELEPDADLHYNIARVLAHLGRYLEAITEYERYLLHGKPEVDLARDARFEISELQRSIGRILVVGFPDGSSIFIDGRLVATAPVTRFIRVNPGTQTVFVSNVEHGTATVTLLVPPGETTLISPSMLQPVPAPDAQASGDSRSFLARHRWSAPLGAGAAALGLGAGVSGLVTWSSLRDLSSTCARTVTGCPPERLEAVEREALVTNALLGGALILGVSAVVSYVVVDARRTGARRRVAIVPSFDGVHLYASF